MRNPIIFVVAAGLRHGSVFKLGCNFGPSEVRRMGYLLLRTIPKVVYALRGVATLMLGDPLKKGTIAVTADLRRATMEA